MSPFVGSVCVLAENALTVCGVLVFFPQCERISSSSSRASFKVARNRTGLSLVSGKDTLRHVADSEGLPRLYNQVRRVLLCWCLVYSGLPSVVHIFDSNKHVKVGYGDGKVLDNALLAKVQ